MRRMIDLHMHIIPAVDDGAENLEISEQMLRMAIEQGVEVVFATSHSFAHKKYTEHTRVQYRKLQKLMKEKGLPVEIYLGCEVFLDPDHIDQTLKDLEIGRLPSLNMTKYVLMELYDVKGDSLFGAIDKLVNHGWKPVIAHAERISGLSIDMAEELKSMGCLLQMNAYSVGGEENDTIKNRALELLDHKLIDFVGSDAHGINHRPPNVKDGIDFLYENYGIEYVDRILYHNAYNLILKKAESKDVQPSNLWLNGMMGLVVGDALGMPVQFLSRADVKSAPIFTMDGFGTYDMPVGAWSDDGSMAIATLDSILNNTGIDYDDIMKSFYDWTVNGKYTPTGKAFDQGNTCMEAIINYARERDFKSCGKIGEYANGNGALMRIMPVCLYSYVQYKNGEASLEEVLEYIHQATALTHNHLRARIASGIYFFMIKSILEEKENITDRLQLGIEEAKRFYNSHLINMLEWRHFLRMENLNEFAKVEEKDIHSSGYVIDSLEAAVWSLITTKSLEEGLLRAVNLGNDTDTVGAIAGGLAALYYGYHSIPEHWRSTIIKRDEIIKLCMRAQEEFYVR